MASNVVRPVTHISYDIPYVLALFPDDHWTPKQVEFTMRKHYSKVALPMGRIYRHLQIIKIRGWIDRSRYGWYFTPNGHAILDKNYMPPWIFKHNLTKQPNTRWNLEESLMSYKNLTTADMKPQI